MIHNDHLTSIVTQRLRDDPIISLLRTLQMEGESPFYPVAESATAPITQVQGREVVMLGAANYLGLAAHPVVVQGARDALERFGSTVTGSRVINGTTDLHMELEREIADWHGTEAAVVFTTGYQANLGAIGALVGAGDTVVVDAAAHASIRDGCRLSQANVRFFAHNRLDALDEALALAADDGGGVLVVVDGLYSMSGVLGRLDGIAARCRSAGAALMVDEAHSVGVLGRERTGAVELFGVADDVDVRMGALSKALGSTGGFVAGSRDVVDAIRVRARSLLFTTAAVPATLGAALAAIRLQRGPEGRELARRALSNARLLWEGLNAAGVAVGPPSTLPSGEQFVSPIVPVHVGDELRAPGLWRQLVDRRVFTGLAVHPTVPRGKAMLRLSVMASHTPAQIEQAVAAFADVAVDVPA